MLTAKIVIVCRIHYFGENFSILLLDTFTEILSFPVSLVVVGVGEDGGQDRLTGGQI